MDLLKDAVEIVQNAGGFEKSRNFFFERHQCPETGQEEKVAFEYHIYKENRQTGFNDMIHFGACPHCNKVFYNTDTVNQVITR